MNPPRPFVILALISALLAVGVGVGGYAALKPTPAPSAALQTVALAAREPPAESADLAANQALVFQIDPGEATARFMIDEVLRGAPNTVVGATDQVAGQVEVDPAHPSAAQLGTILINARTLATGDAQRDRMIRNFILATDQHEYISFMPTALSGLPQETTPGHSYRFQVSGQLTIRGVARDVTFEATVVPTSETELRGTASTIIRYADWDIRVPQVPLVASISDQVRLELEFVADTV